MEQVAVYQGPDREFEVDKDTALWLARMLYGECGDDCTRQHASAVLWSITNRYLLHKSRFKSVSWDSLVKLVRAFSQPLNPLWARGGKLATFYESPERQLKRREKMANLQWHNIPHNIVSHLSAFITGDLEYPDVPVDDKRISNWGSYKTVSKTYTNGYWLDGNYFFEDKGLLSEGEVFIFQPWKIPKEDCLIARVIRLENALNEVCNILKGINPC